MDNHMIFRTVLIILAAVVLFSLVHYYNSKQSTVQAERFYQDNMQNKSIQREVPVEPSNTITTTQKHLSTQPNVREQTNEVRPSDSTGDSEFRAVDFSGKKLPNDCFPKDRLTTEDLLPKNAANLKWSVVNPAGQGDVSNINFVQAGALQGINSTLGSMRNANLQLRSDPVIPNNSGNWPIMMSTIPRNTAMLRKPLEISGDCGDY
uniref:Minor capsid protein P11 C-terminal conserved region domain-containing protein n=1 Tax=viral metagenome TaxID=1070528 RepID=A0A6C0BEW9_9ZZZZ